MDIASLGNTLSGNDISFLERVYETPESVYSGRCQAIGFSGLEKVLDAGCGFGQWSMALSKNNTSVYATDISDDRIRICEKLRAEMQIDNCLFKVAPLDKQPFENAFFDAVFCYGAIFIADPVSVLAEFARILKPGGRLYFTANGFGYTLNLWFNLPNKTADYDPRQYAVYAMQNTIDYFAGKVKGKGQIIIEKTHATEMCKAAGFSVMKIASEGTIDLSGAGLIKPFFPGEYFGFDGVYEVLAGRNG